MSHHLPALLAFLAASPKLAVDDVDPLAIFDPVTKAIWMSEVRTDIYGSNLACRLILMPMPDDSVHDLIGLDIKAADNVWSITACTVGREQAPVDPEAVMAVLAAVRHQIRAGLVPTFDQLLFDHTGLSLPAVARYASHAG